MIPVLVLALTAVATAAQPEHRAEPPPVTLDAPTTIPFTMDFSIPVIELTINGTGPHPFILDTGCSPLLILNQDLVDELELPTGKIRRVGDPSDSEAIETTAVQVESVRVGDAHFKGVEALSWQRPGFFSGEGAPRGVVGLSLFTNALISLDFPNQTVTLTDGSLNAGYDVIKYEPASGLPEVELDIDGQVILAHIDTGSGGGFSLPLTVADKLNLTAEPQIIGAARTVNSEFNIYAADLEGTLSLGPVKLVNPQLNFQDAFDIANIGCGALENFRITFDQRNELLRFEADQARVLSKPQQRKRYGILAGQNPQTGEMTVASCVEGSPAALAGVREGDEIIAINGTHTTELSAASRMSAFRSSPITLTIMRDGEQLEIMVSLD